MKESKHQRRSRIIDENSISPVYPGDEPDPESQKASLPDISNSMEASSSEVNEQHEDKPKGDNNTDEWSVSWP